MLTEGQNYPEKTAKSPEKTTTEKESTPTVVKKPRTSVATASVTQDSATAPVQAAVVAKPPVPQIKAANEQSSVSNNVVENSAELMSVSENTYFQQRQQAEAAMIQQQPALARPLPNKMAPGMFNAHHPAMARGPYGQHPGMGYMPFKQARQTYKMHHQGVRFGNVSQ